MTARRRTAILLIAATTVVAFASFAVVQAGSSARQDLQLGATMPDDLATVVQATWDRFLSAIPARRDCVAPLTVDGGWALDDRARYDPERALVTVRIPGTAPNLEAALVHEFAHHLEFTCPDQADVRADFLAAQGLSPGAPWFEGATWEQTPSEQFAEAMVEVVLGRAPPPPRIRVTAAALDVVRSWDRGS